MQKLSFAVLVLLLIILLTCGGCSSGPSESETKRMAIDFTERFARFNIHKQDHDLKVREIGTAVEEVYYVVEGTIKRESDMSHMRVMVDMEYMGNDGWRLRRLRLNGEYLFEE